MKLLSINLGQERTQQNKNRIETTGIYKIPVDGPVNISKLGIAEDFIASKKHHGGPDQAIYLYGEADYQWWEKELDRDMIPGMFGENLTISGLESNIFNVGDFFHIGDVSLQITSPRIPCSTFATRMGDPQWVKKFKVAERPGLYCRIIREGVIEAGLLVKVEKYQGETISVLQMFRDYYDRNKSEETIHKHLNAPIAIRARVDLEKELEMLTQ
jgi:MOSC domain-containing protein YiiM